MASKLELRLSEYEEQSPVTNDEELMTAIADIIENEESLPETERDFELLEEAIDAYISLSGADIDDLETRASALCEEHVEEIRRKNTVRRLKLRYFLPVAALFTLILVGSIVTYAGWNSLKNDRYSNIETSALTSGDVIGSGEYLDFSTIGELIKYADREDIPVPREIPADFAVRSLSVQNTSIAADGGYRVGYTLVDVEFMDAYGIQRITIESPALSIKDGRHMEIGGREVYMRTTHNGYECNFTLRGYEVTVNAPTLENLRRCVVTIK